jgi:cell division protein FtsN
LNRFTKVFLAIASSFVAYSWASSAQAQTYTVYVTPSDLSTLELVRTVVPDAFRNVVNGERVIQAGRFNSGELAAERRQLLQFSGFNAQQTPPGGVPPIGQPPVVQPPIGQPPIFQPPIGQPPVVSPPVVSPPIGDSGELRYIAAVPVNSANAGYTLQLVRQHYPYAEYTETRRGNYISAGAYNNRSDAEAWSYFLRARGLDARVIYF